MRIAVHHSDFRDDAPRQEVVDASGDAEAIASHLLDKARVDVTVVNGPLADAPAGVVSVVFAHDLSWHRASLPREAGPRVVVLRTSVDGAEELLRTVDAEAVVVYDSADDWRRPAKHPLVIRGGVAGRLSGRFRAMHAHDADYVRWRPQDLTSLAEQLVQYLRLVTDQPVIEGVSADRVEFPLGETFDRGRYQVERCLQGAGVQRLLLARERETSDAYVVALDSRAKLDLEAFERTVTYDAPGVLPLAFVGRPDVTSKGDFLAQVSAWAVIERVGEGAWLPEVHLDPRDAVRNAISLARSAGRILAEAAARGLILASIRPEFMWARTVDGSLEVCGLSTRADDAFRMSRRDAWSEPVFDRAYHAPEWLSAERDDRAVVFALSIMAAEWAIGRFPFHETFHDHGPWSGNHVPLAVPAALARLLSSGMRIDREERPALGAFVTALDRMA